jgi:hypothetical protein
MSASTIHLLLAGGSCGNALNLIAAHLDQLLRDEMGLQPKLTIQNIWQHHGPPPSTDLILQTMPVYRPEEVGCPVLSVRPMIRDREDAETMDKLRAVLYSMKHEQESIDNRVHHEVA